MGWLLQLSMDQLKDQVLTQLFAGEPLLCLKICLLLHSSARRRGYNIRIAPEVYGLSCN